MIVGSEERSDDVGGGRCKIYVCKILPSIIPPSTHPASLPHHYPSRLLCPTAFFKFRALNKLISTEIVSEISMQHGFEEHWGYFWAFPHWEYRSAVSYIEAATKHPT